MSRFTTVAEKEEDMGKARVEKKEEKKKVLYSFFSSSFFYHEAAVTSPRAAAGLGRCPEHNNSK